MAANAGRDRRQRQCCVHRTAPSSGFPTGRYPSIRRVQARPLGGLGTDAAIPGRRRLKSTELTARRRAPPRASGDRGLHHALRLRDAVALRVVDPETGEHLDDLGVLGELGDGLLAGEVPDLVDRAHHLAVDRIAQDLAHEAAVDLEIIDREVLEVAERGQSGAEVIQRELAAELLESLDEAVRLREARHRRGLGDLEADLRAVEPAAMELVDEDRKSTRLNSSHLVISYAVFCLKKKNSRYHPPSPHAQTAPSD